MSAFRPLAIAIATLFVAVAPAHAADVRPFDSAAFAAAQAQGRPILVDVKAWWCPVCASQAATIKKAIAAPAFDKLTIFEVDYDKQQPVWRSFGVRKQGTLISYRGGRELGRLEFITDKAEINRLLVNTVH